MHKPHFSLHIVGRLLFCLIIVCNATSSSLLALDAPIQTAPPDGSDVYIEEITDAIPFLRWIEAEPVDAFHQIQVARDAAFVNILLDETFNGTLIEKRKIRAGQLKQAGRYFWRVRLIGESETSQWSSTRSYRVALVEAIFDMQAIADTFGLTFRWFGNSREIERLRFETSQDSLFNTISNSRTLSPDSPEIIEIRQRNEKFCREFTLMGLSEETDYFARIIAINSLDESGSNVAAFTTGTSQPVLDAEISDPAASRVSFQTSNIGGMGWAPTTYHPVYWPGPDGHRYIFASSVAFTAKKRVEGQLLLHKSEGTNLFHGTGDFVPGLSSEGPDLERDRAARIRHGVFNSQGFDRDGRSKNGPPRSWPVWHNNPDLNNGAKAYRGQYVTVEAERNLQSMRGGPVFMADQEFVCFYKDSDRLEFEHTTHNPDIMPLGLQVRQRIYAWNSVRLQDVLIIEYDIENNSGDTLFDFRLFQFYDTDIDSNDVNVQRLRLGQDSARYVHEHPELQLTAAWGSREYEPAAGFCGVQILEAPVVDSDSQVISDSLRTNGQQLALTTCEYKPFVRTEYGAWWLNLTDSLRRRSHPNAGDITVKMGMESCTVLPETRMRFVVAYLFADMADGLYDGSPAAMHNLVNLARDVKQFYDDEFRFTSDLRPSDAPSRSGLQIMQSNETATIDLDLSNSSNVRIDIYDLSGRLIYRDTVNGLGPGLESLSIPLSAFGTGNYFLQVDIDGKADWHPLLIVR